MGDQLNTNETEHTTDVDGQYSSLKGQHLSWWHPVRDIPHVLYNAGSLVDNP